MNGLFIAFGKQLMKTLLYQLILATTPDSRGGKSPSIVNDNNIKLLFEIQKKVIDWIW